MRDVELAVETYGAPADPPLLLVAGAASSRDLWPPDLCRALADGRHVLRYDHRDTGRSTAWPRGGADYLAVDLTHDAAALIEALDVGPVHLVGMSMGAGIAQAVALWHPERVASLTLVATSPVGGVDGLPPPAERVQRRFAEPAPEPDWSDEEQVTAWWLAELRAYAGPLGIDEADERAGLAAAFARTPDLATAQHHWAVEHGDDVFDARDLAVPTLVVHGTEDPMFPLPHGEALAAAVPGARLLVVDGMGHQVPPRSTWDVVVPAVRDHTARP